MEARLSVNPELGPALSSGDNHISQTGGVHASLLLLSSHSVDAEVQAFLGRESNKFLSVLTSYSSGGIWAGNGVTQNE